MRMLLGGLAAAVAVAVAPTAASANHEFSCNGDYAAVCAVLRLTCHPHYHPC